MREIRKNGLKILDRSLEGVIHLGRFELAKQVEEGMRRCSKQEP